MYATLLDVFARRFPLAPSAHRRAPFVIVTRACVARRHCAERDLAYAVPGRRARVVMLARALELSDEHVVGLLLHELGHLFDPTPDAPGAERRADRVARSATGIEIRYDRRDIQTIGRGRTPRPRHLHR